jgi:hypothetical protein
MNNRVILSISIVRKGRFIKLFVPASSGLYSLLNVSS